MSNRRVEIGCDPAKRAKTLAERGLDFFDAESVFAGPTVTLEDIRRDYGERRHQTYGLLRARWVQVVWTARGDTRHVISMRHCHEREIRRLEERLGRSG